MLLTRNQLYKRCDEQNLIKENEYISSNLLKNKSTARAIFTIAEEPARICKQIMNLGLPKEETIDILAYAIAGEKPDYINSILAEIKAEPEFWKKLFVNGADINNEQLTMDMKKFLTSEKVKEVYMHKIETLGPGLAKGIISEYGNDKEVMSAMCGNNKRLKELFLADASTEDKLIAMQIILEHPSFFYSKQTLDENLSNLLKEPYFAKALAVRYECLTLASTIKGYYGLGNNIYYEPKDAKNITNEEVEKMLLYVKSCSDLSICEFPFENNSGGIDYVPVDRLKENVHEAYWGNEYFQNEIIKLYPHAVQHIKKEGIKENPSLDEKLKQAQGRVNVNIGNESKNKSVFHSAEQRL